MNGSGTITAVQLRNAGLAVRTAELSREMKARQKQELAWHDAQVEFDATLRERERLAADLHDTLAQTLTGVAMQLDATRRAPDSVIAQRNLSLAGQMLAQGHGGSIIHMTSQMGRVGGMNRSVYCATKWGLEGLVRASAIELAPHGIRVNAVAPTFVDTPLTKPFFEDPAFKQWVMERLPIQRLATVEEVAAAVVYLASPGAASVTGTSLAVDGGWTAQ